MDTLPKDTISLCVWLWVTLQVRLVTSPASGVCITGMPVSYVYRTPVEI